jgi:hypothetical protein
MKKQAIMSFMLLGVLGLLIVMNQNKQATATDPQSVFETLDTAKVNVVHIIHKADTLELSKQKGKWMVQPVNWPAKPDMVSTLLKNISTLRKNEIISSNPQKRATFGLDSASQTIVNWKGEQSGSIALGKTSTDYMHTFIMQPGLPNVYKTPGVVQAGAVANSWKDATLIDWSTLDVQNFLVQTPDTLIAYNRDTTEQGYADSVLTKLNRIASLRIDSWPDSIESGSDTTQATVLRLEVRLSGSTWQLRSLGKSPNGVYYFTDPRYNRLIGIQDWRFSTLLEP